MNIYHGWIIADQFGKIVVEYTQNGKRTQKEAVSAQAAIEFFDKRVGHRCNLIKTPLGYRVFSFADPAELTEIDIQNLNRTGGGGSA